jgi:hypothetical protein
MDKDDRIKVNRSLRLLTLKIPKSLSQTELRTLDAVRANYPALHWPQPQGHPLPHP